MGGRSKTFKGNSGKYSLVGMYTEKRGGMSQSPSDSGVVIPEISRIASTYFRSAYTSVYYHYMAIATVFLVVLLSYMLPNISNKIHRTTELKAMKKVLDVMAKEVSRAEVACHTVADQIGCLQCSVQDDSTETTSRPTQELSVCTSLLQATQSEPVIPVQKKLGFFRRIFLAHRNVSNQEVALMSYLYTDSFDGSKTKKEKPVPAEPNIKL